MNEMDNTNEALEFMRLKNPSKEIDENDVHPLHVAYVTGLMEEYHQFKLNNLGVLADVSGSLLDEALKVLRDLADHQNGAPLLQHEEDYNKTMTEVWEFLEANEIK